MTIGIVALASWAAPISPEPAATTTSRLRRTSAPRTRVGGLDSPRHIAIDVDVLSFQVTKVTQC